VVSLVRTIQVLRRQRTVALRIALTPLRAAAFGV
jgi:hypothetical protein